MCICIESGKKGLILNFILRIIENRVSKAGYQKIFTAKIGDTKCDLLINEIIKIDEITESI